MFKLFKTEQKIIKSNKLAKKILKYKLYNPYLKKCNDKEIIKACKNCYSLKDVFFTALKYIEDDISPESILLLAEANFGLGILYNERAIFYLKKYFHNPIKYPNKETEYLHLYTICSNLADCYKKDYLINDELEWRNLSLDYSILFWKEHKKKEQTPYMEHYVDKEIRKRITELNNDIKTLKKVEKQTKKEIDLNKPITNRKVLERIDINTDNIYNLKTGEIIEKK